MLLLMLLLLLQLLLLVQFDVVGVDVVVYQIIKCVDVGVVVGDAFVDDGVDVVGRCVVVVVVVIGVV